jgi:hypothetical protein
MWAVVYSVLTRSKWEEGEEGAELAERAERAPEHIQPSGREAA